MSVWGGAKGPDGGEGLRGPGGSGSLWPGGWASVGIEAMPEAVPLLTRPRPSLQRRRRWKCTPVHAPRRERRTSSTALSVAFTHPRLTSSS